MKVKIGLKCFDCEDINYSIIKNVKINIEKLEFKKFCLRENKYILYKEIKLKS